MNTLNITLGQLNPTVGDFEGNLKLLQTTLKAAQSQGAHLAVTPELSLCGYYPGDYLLEERFLQGLARAKEALYAMTQQYPNVALVYGCPLENQGIGKPLYNGLEVVQNGQVLVRYAKQLLPTYNVFDERRHFEPGSEHCILNLGPSENPVRVGFIICEDGWSDESPSYLQSPLGQLRKAGAELVVSINASPSNINKREQRHSLFVDNAKRYDMPIVYVNQVGGQDSLVFDGASFLVEPNAGVVWECPRFEEATKTVSFDKASGKFCNLAASKAQALAQGGLVAQNEYSTMEFYFRQISLGLKDYMRRCGFEKVLVGSSGGIDSALTIAIAALTLGADKVQAITMPSKYSSTGSVSDSEVLCKNLGVTLQTLPIKGGVNWVVEAFSEFMGYEPQGLALENLQARIRGTLLMTHSNSTGALLLTTGNKSEVSVGYCTLYGDTSGGLNLIGDLYKTEVFELSSYINQRFGKELIPQAIIEKAPSAELAPDQKDSDSLPEYPVLDAFLKQFIEGSALSKTELKETQTLLDTLKAQDPAGFEATRSKVARLIALSEYKRKQAAPIIRVRGRAFGAGRQVPITAKTTQWI